MISLIIFAGFFAVGINAQSGAYGQCGGIGWTGSTTCVAGYSCVYQNDWYSQCVPSTGTTTTSSPKTTTTNATTRTTSTTKTTTSTASTRTPTIYLAGDSTTADTISYAVAQGWGGALHSYVSAPVVDDAVPGKSTRSFTTQGYFQTMYNAVKSGDIVVIEFGHNEGGGLAGNPGNGVCPGTSLTTTCTDTNGTIVYTYFKYLTDAINTFKSKGCTVIVSSQTPNNPYNSPGTPVYVSYAQQVASQTGVYYVDHFNYLLKQYTALGSSATTALFVSGDNVHTNANGAEVAAQAFIRGVLCASSNPLKSYVTKTNVVPASCL